MLSEAFTPKNAFTAPGVRMPALRSRMRTASSAFPDEFKRNHEGDWVDMFIKIAQDNIVPPQVTIDAVLILTCLRPDGVEAIKEALRAVEEAVDDEEIEIEVTYIGAPRYRVTVRAPDYKTAEEALRTAAQAAIDRIKDCGGEGSFARKG